LLSASISPNGKYVAAIGYAGITTGVMLIDLESMSVKTILQGSMESFSKRDPDGKVSRYNRLKEPTRAIWLNDELIAVDFGYTAETINLAGKRVAEIGTGIYKKTDARQNGAPLLVVYTDDDQTQLGLANARTGDITKIPVSLSGVPFSWLFDKHGGLRAVTMVNSAFWKDATTVTHWYRSSVTVPWQKLAEFKVTDNYWVPIAVTEEPNILIVASSVGRDTNAVFNYDIAQQQMGEMLVGHSTEDVLTIRGDIEKTLDGVTINGMVIQKYWFDPVWRDLQGQVDKVLPKRINTLSGNPDQRILVRSSSDTDPGTWLILNTKEMTLAPLGRVQSSIEPAQMLPMKMFSYPAADGLAIPAYLTLPGAAKAPLPMVVMIHGGPQARDTWSWDPEVQLLAAHGYAVFQPQFRGSTGFGNKFLQAGIGQWGLAMQDDITAGVEYLIKLGLVDRNRICIYGASYGGYAALWGLVKTPNLYKCGVSFAGVVDIAYMLEDRSDSNYDTIARQFQLQLLGDPVRDKERFDRVSPLKHADAIKAPVLILHGRSDQRVPLDHAEKMRNALEKLNKPVDSEYFFDEGHGISYVSNANKFYRHLFAFLDKYIGQDLPGSAESVSYQPKYEIRSTYEKRMTERRRVYATKNGY
jgi:dienelactone hydrolase